MTEREVDHQKLQNMPCQLNWGVRGGVPYSWTHTLTKKVSGAWPLILKNSEAQSGGRCTDLVSNSAHNKQLYIRKKSAHAPKKRNVQ